MSELRIEADSLCGNHSIESHNCMTCADTGRVIAVFYNDYDLAYVAALQQRNSELEAKNKEQQVSVDYWSDMFSHSLYGTVEEFRAAAIIDMVNEIKQENKDSNSVMFFVLEDYAQTLTASNKDGE